MAKFRLYVENATKGVEERVMAGGTTVETLKGIEPSLAKAGISVFVNGQRATNGQVIADGDLVTGAAEQKGGASRV